MTFRDALDQLPVEKKARRLKVIWPLIEAKLAEGVSHAAVLELLNRNGFDLTEGTYKNYLHRFRQQRGASSRFRNEAQSRAEATAPAVSLDQAKRPPTFEYDPRGIPDLLK